MAISSSKGSEPQPEDRAIINSSGRSDDGSKLRSENRQKTPKKTKTKTKRSNSHQPVFDLKNTQLQSNLSSTANLRIKSSFLSSISTIFRLLILNPINWLVSLILPHTIGILAAVLTLGLALYILKSSLGSIFHRSMFNSFLPRSIQPLMGSISRAINPLISMPCVSLLPTSICHFFSLNSHHTSAQLADISRAVSDTAKKSSDIFESVIKLSNPTDLGLHQTEIWELGFAVKWSSKLEAKDLLAEQLSELGDLTRDVKDQMMDLNSEGINTFSSIAHEFSRIGDLIELVQTKKRSYTQETISKNLDLLFDHLSIELARLLNSVESSIPLAARSSNLGARVSERLMREHTNLLRLRNEQPLWKKILLDPINSSPRSQQLSHDLSLTSESIKNLKNTWSRLEDVRSDLVNYRNNLAYFKASISGWHLADHGLTPEDELFTLRYVIKDFQGTIAKVKVDSRYNGKNKSEKVNNLIGEKDEERVEKVVENKQGRDDL
ncbi:hypothetical protein BY996DRAFT_4583567 [Phakopsora pachyrhizi]|nr:hypothetical protein BY996DRAFT_4583567 [Phakopsora pachyrhizi]